MTKPYVKPSERLYKLREGEGEYLIAWLSKVSSGVKLTVSKRGFSIGWNRGVGATAAITIVKDGDAELAWAFM